MGKKTSDFIKPVLLTMLAVCLLLMWVVEGTAAAASLAVTAPSAGATWYKGQDYTITWTSSGVTGKVKLHLYKANSFLVPISNDQANTGSYFPFNPGTDLVDGTDYQIRMVDVNTGTISASSGYFTIQSAPSSSFEAVPLYRLYKGGSTKDHFYTMSTAVRDQKVAAGYTYERVEGFVSNSPFAGSKALGTFYIYAQQTEWTSPLYYASLGADNFYTTSKYEYQHAISAWGFTDKGIVGYIATRIANNRPQGRFAGVGMAVGNFTLPSFTDLSLNGVGPQLSFTRYYDSLSPGTTLGQGWSFNYDSYLLEDASGGIHVEWGNGSESHFNGSLIPYPGYFEKAVKINDGVNYGYDVTAKDQTVYKFRRLSINGPNNLPVPGPNILLITITDKHGNTLSLNRQASYGAVMSAREETTGRVFNYSYTPVLISDGRTVQRLTKVTDTSLSPNCTINLAYNAQGNLASITDARNNTTNYTYNADGLLTSITYPEGNTVAVTYNALLKVTGYTNGSISLSFDHQGGATGTTVKNGTNPLVNIVPDPQLRANKITFAGNADDYIQPTYCPGDQLNLQCSIKDRNGNTSYFTYDANGNVLTVKNALNETTAYTYDPQNKNNVTSITDPRGNKTNLTYDANFINLLSVKKPLGGTTTYTYFANGLVETIADPTSHMVTYSYDANGNPSQIYDNALAISLSFTSDNAGRRLTETDQEGQITAWSYDANDNVTSTKVASNPAASFLYDKNDRLIKVIDPRGKATNYTYNTMNLPATQQSPDLKTWQYNYDSVGNVSSVTLPDNNIVTYAYYANNRLQYVRYNGTEKLLYIYDKNGNVLSLKADGDPNKNTSFTYNAANRLTGVTDPFGNVLSYGYDANGNRTSITYPGSKVVNYTYDADNRLITVKDWLGSTATTYTYNSAGILQSVTNANGTITTYGYDSANRLTSLANKRTNNSVIADYSLILDKVGSPTSVTRNEPLARPVPAASDISYTYNDANQILTAGSANYTHDPLGNMSSAGTGRTFAFDFANRLTSATTDSDVFAYVYDGFGNRISRTKNGTQTKYLLDLNVAMSNVLAETDATGSVQNYYVYGLGLVSRINSSGQRYTYHYDAIGNTAAVTDDSGAVTESYSYDEFGATMASSPANSANPFRYVGRYGVMDEGNGLLFMRARYYDAGLGRFISRDPIGFEGGDLNLYAYVGGNPMVGIDASGLTTKKKSASQKAKTPQTSSIPIQLNFKTSQSTPPIVDYKPMEYGGRLYKLTYVAEGSIYALRIALSCTIPLAGEALELGNLGAIALRLMSQDYTPEEAAKEAVMLAVGNAKIPNACVSQIVSEVSPFLYNMVMEGLRNAGSPSLNLGFGTANSTPFMLK